MRHASLADATPRIARAEVHHDEYAFAGTDRSCHREEKSPDHPFYEDWQTGNLTEQSLQPHPAKH
jgi:pyrroloquinoline quinone (PQQ) biosynthesis protein C